MERNFVITQLNRVVMVGKDEYSEKNTSFCPDIIHNELIFHFSGQSTVYFDDLVLETAPNTIRFLPEGKAARYVVERHVRGECIFACFHTDRPISERAFVINVAQNEKIGSFFKKLFSVWVSKGEGYYFESVSLLYRIFAELQKSERAPKRHEQKIAPAVDLIQNDFLKTDFSLEALASLCGMSETYFQRLFKEKYGISPKKYIIQLKVNHACDLLRLGRYTATQIAEMCNFSDVYFFSRQFKVYVGISPTEFKKKYVSSK